MISLFFVFKIRLKLCCILLISLDDTKIQLSILYLIKVSSFRSASINRLLCSLSFLICLNQRYLFIMQGDRLRRFLLLLLLINGSFVIAMIISLVSSSIMITGYTKRPNIYWPKKHKMTGMLTRYIEI